MIRKTWIAILVICFMLGTVYALAEGRNPEPECRIDYVTKTASGYEVKAHHTDYYVGQGGTIDTYSLIFNGNILDSMQDACVMNEFTDPKVDWILSDGYKDYAYQSTSQAVFTLPADAQEGTYTIRVRQVTPDYYGGGPDIVVDLTFTISNGNAAVISGNTASPVYRKPKRPTDSLLYLIDSDSRELTEAELWDWDRESLSFMFNEIFARHGFIFDEGGKFYNHFSGLPWYQAVQKADNQTVYGLTTRLEWKNYETIKKVIAEMEAAGHPYRKAPGSDLLSWSEIPWEYVYQYMTGFSYIEVQGNQKLDVYSAPGYQSWRGANGKAMVSTNGYIYAAGWENGWLQVYYETNAGGIRVGYVDGAKLKGRIAAVQQLRFERRETALTNSCSLTDDPLRCGTEITWLQAGSTVTYLTSAMNQDDILWDYVETTVNGQTVRGYVPAGNLYISE